jgi:hypothetical protein
MKTSVKGIFWRDLTRERIEMMIAISLGVTPLHFGIYKTLPDGLFRHFLVIVPFFFLIFTGRTYGLMIVDRKNSRVCWSELPVAPMTLDGTG